MRFVASRAARKSVPVLIGLSGPSGGGKTESALRLATGIVQAQGGKIFGIDTEAGRMLHYAPDGGEAAPADGTFDFLHVPFGPPFSPLRYLEAIRFCVAEGATTIIVDSMSHEHEGKGGVLDWHDQLVSDGKKDPSAWGPPKAGRRELINGILQLGCNLICCFRAKEGLDWSKPKGAPRGWQPPKLGWQPIAGPEFTFEMTTSILLPPGARGVPCWQPPHDGERQMLKLPRQFVGLLDDGQPLSEEKGRRMAEWARGRVAPWVFPSGEHKGKSISEAPVLYLAGLIDRKHKMSERFQQEIDKRSPPCCGDPMPRTNADTGEVDCVNCGATMEGTP